MPSGCGKDNATPRLHPLDTKLCSRLPLAIIRGNADADAKATCASLRPVRRAEPPLPLDSVALHRHRRRMASAHRAIALFPPQPAFDATVATSVSRLLTPTSDRNN